MKTETEREHEYQELRRLIDIVNERYGGECDESWTFVRDELSKRITDNIPLDPRFLYKEPITS